MAGQDLHVLIIFVALTVSIISGLEISFQPQYFKPDVSRITLKCDFSTEDIQDVSVLRWSAPTGDVMYEYVASNSVNTPQGEYQTRLENYDDEPSTFHSMDLTDVNYCDLGRYSCTVQGDPAGTISKAAALKGIKMEVDGQPFEGDMTRPAGQTGSVKCFTYYTDNSVEASLVKGEGSPDKGSAIAVANSNDCGFVAEAEQPYDFDTEKKIKFTCTGTYPDDSATISLHLIEEGSEEDNGNNGGDNGNNGGDNGNNGGDNGNNGGDNGNNGGNNGGTESGACLVRVDFITVVLIMSLASLFLN